MIWYINSTWSWSSSCFIPRDKTSLAGHSFYLSWYQWLVHGVWYNTYLRWFHVKKNVLIRGFKDKALKTHQQEGITVTGAWFLGKTPMNRVFANNVCMPCLFYSPCGSWEKCSPYTEKHRNCSRQEYNDYWSLWQQQYSETNLKLFPCSSQWERTFLLLALHLLYDVAYSCCILDKDIDFYESFLLLNSLERKKKME